MSNSPAIVSPMAWFRASSQNGMTQPPCVNPFRGSSSGPPGDCMTPSSVTWVIAMSFLIGSLHYFVSYRSDGRPEYPVTFDVGPSYVHLDTSPAHSVRSYNAPTSRLDRNNVLTRDS